LRDVFHLISISYQACMRVIKKSTLHEETANTLRDMIMTGELKEGDKIKENELCASLGISKTPLREALRVLSAEGLVRLVPNRGAYVSTPTFEDIEEMFDVMSVLEGMCARTATEKMTGKDLSSLQNIHERLEQEFERRNQKAYIHFNNLYHTFLQEVAGNQTLSQIINGLRQKILLYRFQSLNLPERFGQSIQEHRELMGAFRNRDPKKAETLMRSHLKKQCDSLEKLRKAD
jgi:DNA-binding GntR family transcriptional regulator